jgi:molecular chaperone DnaJ
MGGRRNANPNRASRGADMRYNIEITLEEAFAGKQATIRVPTSVSCEPCAGSGAEPGTKPQTCPTCAGAGKVRAQQGFFTIERSCPTCNGNGRIVKNPCKNCGGGGRVQKEKTLNVAIPAGIEDGSKIRVTGEGEAGLRGGPKGDLYLFLSVTPHPIFRREGPHVQCRVPVTMATAALGGSVDVPTLGGGKASVKIPEGAQNGKQFRLRGKGMPVMRGQGSGDMFVEIAVETPVNLTKKQQDLLREFEKAGTQQNNPESSSFFARVKEFFDGGAKG